MREPDQVKAEKDKKKPTQKKTRKKDEKKTKPNSVLKTAQLFNCLLCVLKTAQLFSLVEKVLLLDCLKKWCMRKRSKITKIRQCLKKWSRVVVISVIMSYNSYTI